MTDIRHDGYNQPRLILFGDLQNGGTFALAMENQAPILLGESAINAINILFRSHFVFNFNAAQSIEIL